MTESVHDNVNQFFDQMDFFYRSLNRTENMERSDSTGEGFALRIVPRPELIIVLTNCTLYKNKQVNFRFDIPMVELSICLEGEGAGQVNGLEIPLCPNTVNLGLMGHGAGEFCFVGGRSLVTASIYIPVSSFNHYLENIVQGKTADFHRLLGSKSFHQYRQAINPAMLQLVRQLIHMPFSQAIRNIHMECKVLEMLSLSFQQLLFENEPSPSAFSMTRSELEKIRRAREILLERMECPPSLLELSRIAGLNDFKLKAGFKKVYGTTVFGYLREQRLEKAKQLLQSGRFRVGEAAAYVGYTNSSYFADAFRKHYGVNPGEFMRSSSTVF
ncbi:helix-turn-helix transcriptional regulator [Paenibacillus sp. RC84]|uniref:helix-turn-helix transcriptional regulator n=1 Tax=Paenibacillus sp. RC84 TaxID=3156252 RepID=UPI003517D62D